ncbi:hypothetical protein FGG08_007496 [Glutinoglossum americanum]|uniref:Uncharacterized protein n=1 Tax=Glutinoglossum americanum TaxID=1670608 RepID=A0A9P8HW59_9PEZI|nr:hypothetical protein FGG08_007496 [Glutinoglossum americanum]
MKWPDFLDSLGDALNMRYDLTGAFRDLEQAIARTEDALSARSVDHPHRGHSMNNLGRMLWWKYWRTGSTSDLNQAVLKLEKALTITTDSFTDRMALLANLALTLRRKYSVESDYSLLQRATPAAWREVEIAGTNKTYRAATFNNLTYMLELSYKQTGAMVYLQEAIRANEQILIPLVCSHSLGWEDKQHAISRLSGLGGDALSAALQAGEDKAGGLRLLKACRGVTIGRGIDGKSDISRMRDSNLGSPSPTSRWPKRNRTGVMQNLKTTLHAIRHLPDF